MNVVERTEGGSKGMRQWIEIEIIIVIGIVIDKEVPL